MHDVTPDQYAAVYESMNIKYEIKNKMRLNLYKWN